MNIILATDGSEGAEAAGEAIVSRPWPDGTTIHVVSAIPHSLPPPPGPAWESYGYDRYHAHLVEEAERIVARTADILRRGGLHAETKVVTGDPRVIIVEEAERWPADLIVVGSRGLTGVKRWLLGSVAQSVLRHAPCSVEVVRRSAAAASTSTAPHSGEP